MVVLNSSWFRSKLSLVMRYSVNILKKIKTTREDESTRMAISIVYA